MPSSDTAHVTPVTLMTWFAMPGIEVIVSVALDNRGMTRSLKVSRTVVVGATVAFAAGVAATIFGCARAIAGTLSAPSAATTAIIGRNFILNLLLKSMLGDTQLPHASLTPAWMRAQSAPCV